LGFVRRRGFFRLGLLGFVGCFVGGLLGGVFGVGRGFCFELCLFGFLFRGRFGIGFRFFRGLDGDGQGLGGLFGGGREFGGTLLGFLRFGFGGPDGVLVFAILALGLRLEVEGVGAGRKLLLSEIQVHPGIRRFAIDVDFL